MINTSVLAAIQHKAVKLSLNPIVINTNPANPETHSNRADLRYYCTVMVPESYLAPKFKKLVRLEGAEEPPIPSGPGKLYLGAFFEVQNQLDPLLERKAPTFGQKRITVADGLTMPFYCIQTIEDNDVEISSQSSPVDYVIKAGINETDYAAYKDLFFTDYIGQERRFLTWSPDGKLVQPGQPEFLYFLTNFTPSPTALRLCYRIQYKDYTEEDFCREELSNVFPYTVYCAPVGPDTLGIDTAAKEVLQYQVWLNNEKDERISEIRTYRMDQEYRRNVRFILFSNSLGGFDTLCLVGQGQENVSVKRSISDRFTGWEFRPEYSEREINQTTGTRQLKVATGWMNKAALRYLEELILAKEVYLTTDRSFVPLIPLIESFSSVVDDDNLIGRSLAFEYANEQTNFSALPNPLDLPKRPTGWRPVSSACLLDANGRRSGLRMATVLEKYYLDDGTKVVGVLLKSNVPGTDGYIPPVISPDCQVPIWLNQAIYRAGTYLKETCGSGFQGGPALISVAAGLFGSEVSQDDANAKAEAEYRLVNTQAYADQNGTCIVDPFNYAYNVPGNHWHYRAQDPKSTALHWFIFQDPDNRPQIGNAWMVQGETRPYVYPLNSNDLDFPISVGSDGWRILVYGPAGTLRRVKIYQDGVLELSYRIRMNGDGFEYLSLCQADGQSFTLHTGGKVYITNEADGA